MNQTITQWLCASLIGAFFIFTPSVHAQTASVSASDEVIRADALPLRHPGKVQTDAPRDSIEVIEFFSYTCPHCAAFNPQFKAWQAQQADSVRVLYLPISWRKEMQATQRLYFTLQQLGRLDLHEQVYRDYASAPAQFATSASVLSWATQQGFDKKTWQTAYNSAHVSQNVRRAQQAFSRFELNAVPSVVVNGRYAIIPSAQLFDTLNALVAQAHRAGSTPAR